MKLRGRSSDNSLLQILLLSLTLTFTASAAWAQDAVEDEEEDTTADTEEAADLDKVVVTGSRLQRETYTSIAPLQIITSEGSREAGLINTADILQQSTAAGGLQYDLTFSNFVLDNGPGASTIDLRGMGAARTLVLVNGRRLAPSGVEGAPTSPDLNLVPSLMVRQFDVLLDGASSVYGSDAVAGVTNILMRTDFDGFEFDVYYSHPDQDNGESVTAAAMYGMNFDRGFFGIGVEYQESDPVRFMDREWTEKCNMHNEIDQLGEVRNVGYWQQVNFQMRADECRLDRWGSYVWMDWEGDWIFPTPGSTNGGWPNFSRPDVGYWFGYDGDGDGQADMDFRDWDLNGNPIYQDKHLFPKNERLSVMGYGEYTFEGDMNNTAFFEFNYNERDYYQKARPYPFFPYVPANNPYNLCNPNAENGVDCGEASDAFWTDPGTVAGFQDYWGGFCDSIGYPIEFCTPYWFGFVGGPTGAVMTNPVTYVAGDRNEQKTHMEQVRAVFGFKGDLPFVDWGSMSGWVYDIAGSYTKSDGQSWYSGIRTDRADYALGWFSSTHTPCHNDLGYSASPTNPGMEPSSDTAAGCVPLNMYASSLWKYGADLPGDFATQAERDYILDDRDFDTEYTQTLFTAYANGFLFELPGGTAMGGIGLEWREDDIKSIPDNVARDGLFFGWFADGGATGSKWTREVFGEIELPILGGVPGAEELRLNLSGRWTEDEFYGSDFTYSGKLGWRPVNSLLLRGTVGTSFRAPNVREVFLASQTGFFTVTDPCVVPAGAINDLTGEYDPSLDLRDPAVLENCSRAGVDPTEFGAGGSGWYSVESASGGSSDIEAETSKSWTAGFSWQQPFFEAFDFVFGVTYYETEINNTIVEPSAQYLVNQCYADEEFDSPYCQYLTRGASGYLDFIQQSFVNRDEELYRGMDFNANFDQHFNIGTRAASIGIDLVAHKQIEASETWIDDVGDQNYFDYFASRYYPKWKGQMGVRFDISDIRWTWVVNYRGRTVQPESWVDGWSDVYNSTGEGTGSTCFGPPEDVYCRDVGEMDEYFLHSTSVYYYGDTFTIGAGIRNVFDEAPPRVDSSQIWNSYNNTPVGLGYDLMGRTFFFNFAIKM